MGMHEFETGAEIAVTVLDKSMDANTKDLRSMYYSLAKFTAEWDAALQHFQVLEPLLKHRFTYAFQVEEHPDYEQYREYFDGLKGLSDYHGINRVPGEKWDYKENPEVAIISGMLYFDAGGELWQRFVDVGKLTGEDVVAPKEIPVEEIIALVVMEARQQNDTAAISYWYPLISTISMLKPMSAMVLQQNPHLMKIREIVIATEAYKKDFNYGYTRLPLPDYFNNGFEAWGIPQEVAPFYHWWYAPLKEWYENPGYAKD